MSETVILTPDAPWRGCSAKFSQPLSAKDKDEAQNLALSISTSNHNNIVYRTGDGDQRDIRRQVFRWDLAPYKEVFQKGLQVRRRSSLSQDQTLFYSLGQYVQGIGSSRPLDSRTESSYAFISTTVSNSWYPPVPAGNKTLKVYRYEIYAPGGIWVSATLGGNYPKRVPRHDEVAFVGGVAPQYIRSAQAFTLTGGPNDGSTVLNRDSNMLLINESFNPQSHPLRFLEIEHPVCDYPDGALVQRITNKRQTNDPNVVKWYAKDVAKTNLYLSSAFRASRNNEAYYILHNMVTQLFYDPGGNNDYIVNGPSFVSQMFRSLEYTPFGEHGIDAAFQLQADEVMIFSGNLCALINCAPRAQNDSTQDDKILKGPMTIPEMIPVLKGTVFENGLDSAFESKLEYQYFLTKGTVCAQIVYDPETREFELNKLGQITQIIPLLRGTVYERNGIDAAYGSHAQNEVAYLFQSNNWAILQYDLTERKETIYGPQVMGSDAGAIAKFAPRKNRGLDMRDDAGPLPRNPDDYDHDQVEPPQPERPHIPSQDQVQPPQPERPHVPSQDQVEPPQQVYPQPNYPYFPSQPLCPPCPPYNLPCGRRPRSPSCSPCGSPRWGSPCRSSSGSPAWSWSSSSGSPCGSPPYCGPPPCGPPYCGPPPCDTPYCGPPDCEGPSCGPHCGRGW